MADHITLTVREILDLADFARDSEPDEEYVVETADPGGIRDDDTGEVTHHRFVAYLAEYPEEGVFPLGPPLARAINLETSMEGIDGDE